MKNIFPFIVLLSFVTVMVSACGTALKSVKPSSDPTSSTTAQSESEKTGSGKARGLSSDKTTDKPPAPSADLGRSGLSEAAQPVPGMEGLNQRAEINQSALEFAKNFTDVRAIRTRYSKLYGGWNLDLFVGKGKKLDQQQFSWNGKSKEWELTSYLKKQIPVDKLEYNLDTEFPDEKCFVLKR